MKIGMVLQDTRLTIEKMDAAFDEVLKSARENKLDLLVFPEHFYCPDEARLAQLAFLNYPQEDGGIEGDFDEIGDIFKEYAKAAGCPVLASRADKYGFIYALCVSAEEGIIKWYGKHIATNISAFQTGDYDTAIDKYFNAFELNGFKIGITICYDSNKSLFSAAYGEVDLLINLTGGHVDYKKWSIYQKARALENRCNNLCTMAYFDSNARNKSYVFGFDGYGKKLPYQLANDNRYLNNDRADGLYIYEIDLKHETFKDFDKEKSEPDEFLNAAATVSKNISVNLGKEDLVKILSSENRIVEGLYAIRFGDETLVIIDAPEQKIEDPIFIEHLFYHQKLINYSKKKYLIINRWEHLDRDYYERRLSTILKVRAAENYCIVILLSDQIDECIQVGMTKNVQIVKRVDGKYGLDLKRATGPESFWKNNQTIGVRKEWRNNYELLINRSYKERFNNEQNV
ncbi:MAG: hypothetical protein PWR12_1112 [Eubacteriaceae bacterium]|jgi:predicted amidohydrolase|nr:hypothetical protein [Eubacteriaceae bacterium]MDK2937187.1 hypothetical protein [Eubacteriaceae bacterium]